MVNPDQQTPQQLLGRIISNYKRDYGAIFTALDESDPANLLPSIRSLVFGQLHDPPSDLEPFTVRDQSGIWVWRDPIFRAFLIAREKNMTFKVLPIKEVLTLYPIRVFEENPTHPKGLQKWWGNNQTKWPNPTWNAVMSLFALNQVAHNPVHNGKSQKTLLKDKSWQQRWKTNPAMFLKQLRNIYAHQEPETLYALLVDLWCPDNSAALSATISHILSFYPK